MKIFSSPSKKNEAKVLALLNQKGGVGKTTLTFNLAYAFQQMDKSKKILCLDMDPQANLTLLMGKTEETEKGEEDQPPFHIHHLLVNSLRELKVLHQPVLLSDVLRTKDEVDFIPSGQELSGLELTVAAINSPRQLLLKRFLEKSGLLNDYDYILIDGPPTLGLLVVNIICASHGLLVPFQPDQFSRNGLSHLHQTLEDVAEMDLVVPPQILGYIPNLVDGRRKQEEKDMQLIQDQWETPMGKIFPPFENRVPLVKSNSQKKSVFAFASKEYKDLQQQFLDLAHYVREKLS